MKYSGMPLIRTHGNQLPSHFLPLKSGHLTNRGQLHTYVSTVSTCTVSFELGGKVMFCLGEIVWLVADDEYHIPIPQLLRLTYGRISPAHG